MDDPFGEEKYYPIEWENIYEDGVCIYYTYKGQRYKKYLNPSYTLKELSEILEVPASRISSWIKSGLVEKSKKVYPKYWGSPSIYIELKDLTELFILFPHYKERYDLKTK